MSVGARLDQWEDVPGQADGPDASPSDPAEEAALVAAAVQGDHHAFAALYDRLVDRVYRHCYYRTGNRADAEDLTQQTFLHAWRAIGRYRAQGVPFVAWLLAISQNLATNHHRRPRETTLELETIETDDGLADPAEIVAVGLRHDRVRRAITRLAPDRRQVITLRFIEDFSVRETAEALGKTEGNVRVLQHRALADLRRLLAEPVADVSEAPRSFFGQVRQVLLSVQRGLSARTND